MDKNVEAIKLTNLDYAVAAYRHYNTTAENLSKLELEDVYNEITEIRGITFSYGDDFVNEKKEKGYVYEVDTDLNHHDYSDPFCVLYEYDDSRISKPYVYDENKVDNFIGAKIIEWIGEPEELRDTLEQATLNKNGNFYISDLINFYKKENISLDELPKEIEEKFKNGEYDKFKNEKNKSNYEELKSLIENKEIASSFNVSSSNNKKMRM
ncbi:hypothetical protein [Klebsiella michiganensis]|uniref:hypothetical protein n=1 Tax=Klebsiella michiganensis TaxID=1134687 RepID=UPI0013D0EF92|nr:hypothetical protein [Klebsiella michiganensis]